MEVLAPIGRSVTAARDRKPAGEDQRRRPGDAPSGHTGNRDARGKKTKAASRQPRSRSASPSSARARARTRSRSRIELIRLHLAGRQAEFVHRVRDRVRARGNVMFPIILDVWCRCAHARARHGRSVSAAGRVLRQLRLAALCRAAGARGRRHRARRSGGAGARRMDRQPDSRRAGAAPDGRRPPPRARRAGAGAGALLPVGRRHARMAGGVGGVPPRRRRADGGVAAGARPPGADQRGAAQRRAAWADSSPCRRRTGLPLRVLEIGSSAGLNLCWDRYRYEVVPERTAAPRRATSGGRPRRRSPSAPAWEGPLDVFGAPAHGRRARRLRPRAGRRDAIRRRCASSSRSSGPTSSSGWRSCAPPSRSPASEPPALIRQAAADFLAEQLAAPRTGRRHGGLPLDHVVVPVGGRTRARHRHHRRAPAPAPRRARRSPGCAWS